MNQFMIDQFFTLFGTPRTINSEQILFAMLLSFALSFIFATIYRWTFQGFSYSRSFIHTMILGSMVVCMIIMAIGNNMARGIGIMGTLAIIRFRTQIRDSRDMIFLFSCLGVGISAGSMAYNVAVLGTLLIGGAALIMHWSPFASRRKYEGLLRFTLPARSTQEPAVDDVLKQCCGAFHLIAMREAAQGDAIEYSYHVRLLDPSYRNELVQRLNNISEVSGANLLLHRTTVDL